MNKQNEFITTIINNTKVINRSAMTSVVIWPLMDEKKIAFMLFPCLLTPKCSLHLTIKWRDVLPPSQESTCSRKGKTTSRASEND